MLLREAIDSLEEEFDMKECYDGRSAINFLREQSNEVDLPCLVVLDINMPILDGREALAILKSDQHLKNIPVVIFTTSSNPTDIKYCAQFNVQLLSKPFNLSKLQDIAREIVSRCDKDS